MRIVGRVAGIIFLTAAGAAVPVRAVAAEHADWRAARLAMQREAPARAGREGDDGGIGTDCTLAATSRTGISSSETCVRCHTAHETKAHPVEVDYDFAQARSGGGLRPAAAVVDRGVFLPDGRVGCLTCHDPRSPWADHIALPPGAPALAAVDAGNPNSYEGRPNWRIARNSGQPTPELPVGSRVTAAPLCAACHTYAD